MKLRRRKLKPQKELVRVVSEDDLAQALINSGGLQAVAGKMVNISQSAVSQRIKNSPHLQEVVTQVKNELLDIAESELRKHIYRGNLVACIFYLKTVGKERGYNEKSELDINANIKGGVLLVPGMAASAEDWLAKYPTQKQKQLTGGTDDEESNSKNRTGTF